MVTGLVSRSNVEVDGVPRHVLNIRRLVRSEDGGGCAASGKPPNLSSGGGDPGADENGLRVLREESSDDETSDNAKMKRIGQGNGRKRHALEDPPESDVPLPILTITCGDCEITGECSAMHATVVN